jgi:hypothetical protein
VKKLLSGSTDAQPVIFGKTMPAKIMFVLLGEFTYPDHYANVISRKNEDRGQPLMRNFLITLIVLLCALIRIDSANEPGRDSIEVITDGPLTRISPQTTGAIEGLLTKRPGNYFIFVGVKLVGTAMLTPDGDIFVELINGYKITRTFGKYCFKCRVSHYSYTGILPRVKPRLSRL